MGDKSARKNTGKTAASRTLTEKRLDRADKEARSARSASIDAVSAVEKR